MEEGMIVLYGDEVLRTKAEEIGEINDEICELIQRMYVAMAESRGLGVAGPQVGVSKRLFVYDIGDGRHALINPKLLSGRGEDRGLEGCLSIPGLQGEVARYESVTVTGINEDGKKVRIRAEGLMARLFQHEIDHLDGMMFIDRADPDTLETVPAHEEDEPGEE